MENNDTVETIGDEFTIKGKKVYIFPLSDLHLGTKPCNFEFFRYWEKIFNSTNSENKIIYLMGDLIDLPDKRIGPFDIADETAVAIKTLKRLLKPYAPYVRGMVPGNHELRAKREFNLDVSELIADDLGIPYNPFDISDTLLVNGKEFNIFARHGWNHGKKPISVMNTFINDMQDNRCDTDLCMVGHNHLCDFRSKYYRTKDDTYTRKYFAFTGHFLDPFSSYARGMNKPLTPEAFLRLELNKNCKLSCTQYNIDEECPDLVNPYRNSNYDRIY